jgi:catechol 2,3-dioxygenase-like lactoylglutathione lyase family enzyme
MTSVQGGPGWQLQSAPDIGIVVRDIDVMLRFYRDVIGLPYLRKMQVPNGVLHVLGLGSQVFKLSVPDTPPATRHATGGIHASTGLRYWTATVTGLDALLEICLAGGATTAEGVQDAGNGIRYVVIADPEGNCFELIERREA